MKGLVIAFGVVMVLGFAFVAQAAGPHDMECIECHSTHYAKGSFIVGVEPGQMANPARTASATPIDALCLGCHNGTGATGINLHATHPTGVKPTYTNVPGELMWDGVFTCVSCHNPHPSNANYKYLIIDTADGASMGTFCAKCHPDQSDPESVAAANAASVTSDSAGAPIVPVGGGANPLVQ
ncbi:MAG: cytochrome C [Proteobacteria bacterium]|nr:cytochrome C [Pseudomonadota bacterium]MBU1612179.1 cytochrome C [Pseudomonadota bacterium]